MTTTEMTLVVKGVFAGLTDANPYLIDRALALMNDVRLSRLEPLRAALMAGALTLRIGTWADRMTGPALFIQANKGGAGQVVLRRDGLRAASDTAVLQFIDNLVYAGLGHGGVQATERRASAQDAPSCGVGPGTTPTDQADLSVRAMSEDEASARYQSWLFREQLDTLATSYTLSNRALLATDLLYRRFAKAARDRQLPQRSWKACDGLCFATPRSV